MVLRSDIAAILRNLSPQDFRDFGSQQIAYIKTEQNQEGQSFVVYSANGTEVTVQETLELAILETRQNNLEPVTVH